MVEEAAAHPAGIERPLGRRGPDDVEGMRLRRHGQHGRRFGGRAEPLRPLCRIEGRRHDDETEVLAQVDELPAHREREIRVELALVDLVEDDGGDPGEFGIGQQPAQQHARRDELDLRAGRHRRLTADREADILAEAGPRQLGEPTRRGTGGHPSRLGDDDATGRPAQVPGPAQRRTQVFGDERGHECRLAGSGRGLDDESRIRLGLRQLPEECRGGQSGADRLEVEGVHAPSLSGRSRPLRTQTARSVRGR